jgi:hypothetical protein
MMMMMMIIIIIRRRRRRRRRRRVSCALAESLRGCVSFAHEACLRGGGVCQVDKS